MTTSPEVDEADRAVFQRLSRLAFDEAGRSTPSAVVDMALRNSNRRRRARAGLTLVAGLGAVALVLPQVSDAIWSTSPARPGLTTPVGGASAEPPVIAPAGVGATFGELTLRVDFDVQVASSEPVPGGGECVVFDLPDVLGSRGGPVPSLAGFAAAGCRGGVVSHEIDGPVDPQLPFAATVVDLGACTLQSTGPVTTTGDLAAVRSAFTCDEGTLNQWIFDEQVLWSLDGGPRMTRFVESATLATNR